MLCRLDAIWRLSQQVFNSLFDLRQFRHISICNCDLAILPFAVFGSSETSLIDVQVHCGGRACWTLSTSSSSVPTKKRARASPASGWCTAVAAHSSTPEIALTFASISAKLTLTPRILRNSLILPLIQM